MSAARTSLTRTPAAISWNSNEIADCRPQPSPYAIPMQQPANVPSRLNASRATTTIDSATFFNAPLLSHEQTTF